MAFDSEDGHGARTDNDILISCHNFLLTALDKGGTAVGELVSDELLRIEAINPELPDAPDQILEIIAEVFRGKDRGEVTEADLAETRGDLATYYDEAGGFDALAFRDYAVAEHTQRDRIRLGGGPRVNLPELPVQPNHVVSSTGILHHAISHDLGFPVIGIDIGDSLTAESAKAILSDRSTGSHKIGLSCDGGQNDAYSIVAINRDTRQAIMFHMLDYMGRTIVPPEPMRDAEGKVIESPNSDGVAAEPVRGERGLTAQQLENATAFAKEPGRKEAVIIEGTDSLVHREAEAYLQKAFRIEKPFPRIHVENKAGTQWGAVFEPGNGALNLLSEKGDITRRLRPFGTLFTEQEEKRKANYKVNRGLL